MRFLVRVQTNRLAEPPTEAAPADAAIPNSPRSRGLVVTRSRLAVMTKVLSCRSNLPR